MKNLRKAAMVVCVLSLATIGTPSSYASESTKELSANAVTDVEVNPGESAIFRKGYTAKIELLTDQSNSQRSTRSTDLHIAPNCIVAKEEKGFIQVYNNCGGTEAQRIKVTLAFAPDTACKSIEPGTRSNVGFAYGKIDGVYLC